MAAQTQQKTASHVYGIVPADVQPNDDARGIGDPPAEISVIQHGDIAALVSEIAADQALGNPEDLATHARLLDAAAAETPVLPLRFGSVLTDSDAVKRELLEAHHDEFAAALNELEGKAQYLVRGRYEEKAILSEVLEENEQARQLREAIREKGETAARDDRIALGELVSNAIAAKREEDTRTVITALEKLGCPVNPREPTHEEDAVHVACLAETARQPDLEQAVGELADEWRDRVQLRLLGPLAPYDFVVTRQE